jgi:transposase
MAANDFRLIDPPPPHSPDLAPADFLFPTIKRLVAGKTLTQERTSSSPFGGGIFSVKSVAYWWWICREILKNNQLKNLNLFLILSGNHVFMFFFSLSKILRCKLLKQTVSKL